MLLVIVSGRSGSGKSVALRALEDIGFYCVDNLPLVLLPELTKTLVANQRPVAISLDIRNLPANQAQLNKTLTSLPSSFSTQIIFLDTDRNTLLRRYSETRREHPLSHQHASLEASIDAESQYLEPLRHAADLIINTTGLSIHELSDKLREHITGKKGRELTIVFESFGFKYGLPNEADFVFDVRFLPNPHWDPELTHLNGLDTAVIDFFSKENDIDNFITQTSNYLFQWLPDLEKNNRHSLTIGIGCTGGQHRSVYIAERLSAIFSAKAKRVMTRHRNLKKN